MVAQGQSGSLKKEATVRTEKKLCVGDIVMSKKFVSLEVISGIIPRVSYRGNCCDESRAQAKFIVIEIIEEIYTGCHNDAPDKDPCACEVIARRLNEDGTLGETISFYQEYYSWAIPGEFVVNDIDLQIVGHR